MFTVINGKKDETIKKRKELRNKKRDIYFRCFAKNVVAQDYNKLLSAIFCGVRYVNFYDLTPEVTYKELKDLFNFIVMLKNIMRYITVNDLISLFPIIKEYNGEKFECKDYFSTKKYLETLNLENCLLENIDDFLWNYYNQDLMNLSIKELLILDKLRKYEGEKGLMEEWTDMMGVPSYIINEKQGYIYNRQTKKTEPYRKAYPKYLKIIR